MHVCVDGRSSVGVPYEDEKSVDFEIQGRVCQIILENEKSVGRNESATLVHSVQFNAGLLYSSRRERKV